MEINDATRRFIADNKDSDVRQLALRGSKDAAVDVPFALDQIRGRQVAQRKLPLWAATEGIVYPPHLSLEQSSGEPAARYKASLAGSGQTYVDLTGGMGADFSFMSAGFRERIYVEQSPQLCDLTRHNLPLLGLDAKVVESDAATFLQQMDCADVVFIDPARRSSSGTRTYALADCSPNVVELMPLLGMKAQRVIMKLSPMLDWHKAVEDLMGTHHPPLPKGWECEVHILSVGNECKELIVMLTRGEERPLRLVCANDGNVFSCIPSEQPPVAIADEPQRGHHLYVPNASLMKGGCFGAVGSTFGMGLVAPNSHLFCSQQSVSGTFPGRHYVIETVTTMNRRQLKSALAGIRQANISCRNFPLDVASLRRKLRLSEGGDTHIFATTTHRGNRLLLVCSLRE